MGASSRMPAVPQHTRGPRRHDYDDPLAAKRNAVDLPRARHRNFLCMSNGRSTTATRSTTWWIRCTAL